MALLVALAACGASTPPEPVPAAESPAAATTAPDAPAAAPTAMPQPTKAMAETPRTGKDKAVAVIGTEPVILVGVGIGIDAHIGQLVDTLAAYIGHLDKDTLQISPTSMIQSWKQTAPDGWEYKLRPGVTFHDGEE